MTETILAAFEGNPYFTAGFGLFGVGTALALFRSSFVHGARLARSRLLVSLEIPSKDKAYPWVLHWMSTSPTTKAWSPTLSVQTQHTRHDNGSTKTEFGLVAGPGTHVFRFRGAWFMVERTRERQMLDLSNAAPWETVTLTTLSRDRKLFPQLLEEARVLALEKEEGKTVIYSSYGPDWRPFGQPRRRRPLDSVLLAEGVSERILKDVRGFIDNGSWYYDRGIPYRRGYLLYGVPGSGKTSFILALAGHLEYNICVLNLAERGLTDDRLNHLLSHAPHRSLILLEDIDAAFSKRAQSDKQGFASMVTFSGLLNALDGVASSEERIIFMTTNHVSQLDPALIRPGRVDLREEFGWATPHQIRGMFRRFFGDSDVELCEKFVKALQGRHVSTAVLQGHFVEYRDSPKLAVERAIQIGSPASP
ncbi:hypothetical protein M427DRAFT_115431 [Gonapodya prolifera JEL478]|uniref:Mitochondrial chaperone BCS1 n=1 Tax=Gonapodya prolifera (strain JEL478) TaxID=1344416 RepID=A0A139A256_GONPJ|nr:hypothetical protein M427DRAFT_115431 [Gonapodya prolifera JEL478]|eukprot:KXS10852.1 hypothetical protein M427DRAFT_115431 [Gonapodya prolifera JEL478]